LGMMRVKPGCVKLFVAPAAAAQPSLSASQGSRHKGYRRIQLFEWIN
jgi:hypothetical protein